jgi:hypothetical protein
MKLPTTFPVFVYGNQKQEIAKPINDSLKGLRPVNDLREDLNFIKMNSISSKDTYTVDCRTEMKKLEEYIKQVTPSCGGG